MKKKVGIIAKWEKKSWIVKCKRKSLNISYTWNILKISFQQKYLVNDIFAKIINIFFLSIKRHKEEKEMFERLYLIKSFIKRW